MVEIFDMEEIFSHVNAVFLGILISLSIRWGILIYAAYKIKANRRGPLDRVINISSDEILNGVIRKRMKQVKAIMDSSVCYDTKRMDEVKRIIPTASPSIICSIFESFKNKHLSFALIPNEDVYIAKKKALLDNYSHYFLNDDINREKYKLQKAEEKKKYSIIEQKRKQKELQEMLEDQLRKQKEQEIEDSINI